MKFILVIEIYKLFDDDHLNRHFAMIIHRKRGINGISDYQASYMHV